MTDQQPPEGGWQASDGKWYPLDKSYTHPAPGGKPRSSKRRTTTLLVVLCAALVLAIGAVLAERAGIIKAPAPPIYQQDCSQLADTYRQITADLAPDKSFDTKQRATEDGSALNARVDELGGCPSEPSLK